MVSQSAENCQVFLREACFEALKNGEMWKYFKQVLLSWDDESNET